MVDPESKRLDHPAPFNPDDIGVSDDSGNLPVPFDSSRDQTTADALSGLDRRIVEAPTEELSTLIQARGAMIEQDEWRRECEHRRRGQMGVFYSKIGFSIAAAVGGGALVLAGFGLPAFFILGASAAVYVPEYMSAAMDMFKSGDGNAQ